MGFRGRKVIYFVRTRAEKNPQKSEREKRFGGKKADSPYLQNIDRPLKHISGFLCVKLDSISVKFYSSLKYNRERERAGDKGT